MSARNAAEEGSGGPPPGRAGRTPGALALGVALAASLALSLQHLGGLSLPGCGLESACARAASSRWGALPGLGWPTAHLGSAFFAGLLAAWVVSRGSLARSLVWLARAGALVSLALVVLMIAGGYACPWCAAAHAGNLVFVLVAWRSSPGARAAPSWTAFVVGFAAVTGALAFAEHRAEIRRRERAEADLASSQQRIPGADGGSAFTGRYRLGPERAAVRIVLFTDYQCPDCRAIEAQVRRVRERWPAVSISVKQFPFCAECNRWVRGRGLDPHPAACRAARAAEAAGMLGGAEGFWQLHRWLFDRGGVFTDAELEAVLGGLGLDHEPFVELMNGPETLARVEADVEEGISLGLRVTPTIFVNGEELEGWTAPQALVRTVERLQAASLPAETAAADRPETGIDRFVTEWRTAPRRAFSVAGRALVTGDAARADSVDVVVWGDYLDEPTRELDARLRAVAANEPRLRYSFRPFPLESGCNPGVPRTLHAGACRVATEALAALDLGGEAAYRAVHALLMQRNAIVAEVATAAGVAPERLVAGAQDPGVLEALRESGEEAGALGLRSIPFWFVDGRQVLRWKLDDEPVVERILAEALHQ